MYCTKCGKAVSNTAFYCEWCGTRIESFDPESIVDKAKYLVEELNRAQETRLELSKYIARIFDSGEYSKKYQSFEEFGASEFGMKKDTLFMYKDVGAHFFDKNGTCLIPRGNEWSVSNLRELYQLDISTINMMIEKQIIGPETKQAELRHIVKLLDSQSPT